MLEDQALLLTEFGRYREAEQLLDEGLAIRKKVGQKMDRNYLVPRIRLALALDKPDEAADFVERHYGAAPQGATLSSELLTNLETRAEIALIKNDGRTAIAMAGRALDAVFAGPARPYLKVHEARAALEKAQGYLLTHEPPKALPLLEGTVKAYTELFDSNSPEIALAEATLGNCYVELGDRHRAQNALSRSLAILQVHKGLGQPYRAPAAMLARRLSGRE
jgi:tetratricopeptide (TPR) repeat protein